MQPFYQNDFAIRIVLNIFGITQIRNILYHEWLGWDAEQIIWKRGCPVKYGTGYKCAYTRYYLGINLPYLCLLDDI